MKATATRSSNGKYWAQVGDRVNRNQEFETPDAAIRAANSMIGEIERVQRFAAMDAFKQNGYFA